MTPWTIGDPVAAHRAGRRTARLGAGMKAGSLCTGYGGLDLAVTALLDAHPIWLAEFDQHAAKVCAARFPGVPNLHDIAAVDWATVEPIDVLTAGYPCQPFSHAGRRKGTDDPRHLWPHIARAIGVLRPRLVVLENVAAHVSLGFDSVLGDLAELGFDAEWCVVRASDVGACHQRKRLFVVATDARGERRDGRTEIEGDGRHAPERSEALGLAGHRARSPRGTAPDPGRQRHGRGQDAGALGRVDGEDAGGSRERQRARPQPGDRGAAPAADSHDVGHEGAIAGPRRHDLGGGARPAPDIERDGRSRCDDTGSREGLGAAGSEPARTHPAVAWGDYGPAIRRHEHLAGRPAPSPVDLKGRLSPVFVEWMMCLPAGWVTDCDISRTQALKILGNGVVPPQAAHAIAHLLEREAVAA